MAEPQYDLKATRKMAIEAMRSCSVPHDKKVTLKKEYHHLTYRFKQVPNDLTYPQISAITNHVKRNSFKMLCGSSYIPSLNELELHISHDDGLSIFNQD